MRGSMKLVSMLLVLCLTLGALPLAMAEEVVDADLTCTITLATGPRIRRRRRKRRSLRATAKR